MKEKQYINLLTGEVIPKEGLKKEPAWLPVISYRDYVNSDWKELEDLYELAKRGKWMRHLYQQALDNPNRLFPLNPETPPTHKREVRWFTEELHLNIPRSVNLSELCSILWNLTWGAHEESCDAYLFGAPHEIYSLINKGYLKRYKEILDAYGLTGDDLLHLLEERVPHWAYRAGFHIPIEVC